MNSIDKQNIIAMLNDNREYVGLTEADLEDAQLELDEERALRAAAWEQAKREVAEAQSVVAACVAKMDRDFKDLTIPVVSVDLWHKAKTLLQALDTLDRLEKEGC